MAARSVLPLLFALCVAEDATPKPTPLPTAPATPLPTAVPTPAPTPAPAVPFKETIKAVIQFPVPDVEVDLYNGAGVKLSLEKCLAKAFNLAATEPQPKVEEVCNLKNTVSTAAGPRCEYLMMGIPTPAPTAMPTPAPTPVPTTPAPPTAAKKASRRLADVTRETLHFEYMVNDLEPAMKAKVVAGIAKLEESGSADLAEFVGEFVTSTEFAAAALTPITADDVTIPEGSTVIVTIPESFGTNDLSAEFADANPVDGKFYKMTTASKGKTCKNHEDIYFKETVKDAAFYDLTLPSKCATDCSDYVPPDGKKKCVGFEIIMKDETEAHCLLHNGKCVLSDEDPQPPGTEGTLRGQFEFVQKSDITKETIAAAVAAGLILACCVYYMFFRPRKPAGTPGKRGIKKPEPEPEAPTGALPYFVQPPMLQMQPVQSFGVQPQMYAQPGYGYQPMGMAGFR